MKKLQPKFLEYTLGSEEDNENIKLNQLVEKFEAGEMDAEEYMEAVESLQFRESNQVSVVQAWAMTMEPNDLFAAVEDYDLVERYGARIIVSIASALESSIGRPILTTLNNEVDQFDQVTQQELRTFMRKIGGGF
jgi:selenocysteine lyase/cysteine desulfurase